jgi:hypothetical protein
LEDQYAVALNLLLTGETASEKLSPINHAACCAHPAVPSSALDNTLVEQLAQGEVQEAIQNLDRQGRVHEIQAHDERIAAIAKEYAQLPENTLVISPDNRSRIEINERIHSELQRSGLVSNEEHRIRTLVHRPVSYL